MKEPIRKVLNFSGRLKNSLETRLNSSELELFKRVENATLRMGLLIDDLLEFSHINYRPLQKEEVDLGLKLNLVIADLELLIEEKQAILEITVLPIVKGYKRQLQQLIQNLVSNALKYSKPGIRPIINISAQEVFGSQVNAHILPGQAADRFHLVEVKDNGIGFEPQYAQRIFGMFQRLHGKHDYPGTGVGLSIVRKVVENHQGHIWAESQLGEGATFKILLPVE